MAMADLKILGADPDPGFAVLKLVSTGPRDTRVFVRCNIDGTIREFELDWVTGVAWKQLDPDAAPELELRADCWLVNARVKIPVRESLR
jgi:hypothetical protein